MPRNRAIRSDGAFELLRRNLRQNAAVMNGEDFLMPAGRKLSRRERQVLGHLIRGRTNREIAKLLRISESMVKTFVTRIHEKLEVRTRLDLLSLAIERGWVQQPHAKKGGVTRVGGVRYSSRRRDWRERVELTTGERQGRPRAWAPELPLRLNVGGAQWSRHSSMERCSSGKSKRT